MRWIPVFALLSASAVGCTGVIETPDHKGDNSNGGVTPPEGDPDTGGDPTTDPDTTPPGEDTGGDPTDTATPPPDSTPPTGDMPRVNDLAISEIAVFQAVKVSIAKSGSKVSSRNADVIAGREALVRVYVTPGSAWSPREVTGELTITSGGSPTKITATATPSGASTDASLGSTINFSVGTGVIAVGSTYSVVLRTTKGQPAGDSSGAQYPAGGGEDSLDARSTGETLKITIVPIRYNADGSGRLPDTSAAQIETYRKAFYGMYPAKKVEVTVRAPWDYSSPISANGSGFGSALSAVVKLRQTDGAPKDVYYYGAFAGASSFGSYCPGGCVTGLCGLLTSPSDTFGRACVGIGFSGEMSAGTATHEVGHAHGRAHAPCGGVSDYDSSFPYSGGKIGPYGYDLANKKLIDPATYRDLMGYCSPNWISDYTFKALTNRMAFVGGASMSFPGGVSESYDFRFVQVEGDGKLTWGEDVTLHELPMTDTKTLTWESSDGKPIGTATGYFYAYDHLPGGYLLVPKGPAGYSTMRVSGLGTTMAARIARFVE